MLVCLATAQYATSQALKVGRVILERELLVLYTMNSYLISLVFVENKLTFALFPAVPLS